MNILIILGIGLLALVAILLVIALFLPKEMHAEREIVINRPRSEVFGYISHLKNQNDYSVWATRDPNMKKEFRGTDGQPGFVSSWEGNKDVGKGEQEIKGIKDGERMDTELRFEKPFKSQAESYMTTSDAGPGQTKVTWGFKGTQPYPMNIMQLFMNMDKMIGGDFETGLKNLKKNLESMPAAAPVPAPSADTTATSH